MALSRDLYRAFDKSFERESSTSIGQDVTHDYGHVISIRLASHVNQMLVYKLSHIRDVITLSVEKIPVVM